ncbi:response regulator [Plantactinospora solaniradicis]|uniref:Response regulator n=1 Tax=Plantactinospora solaniradicis TaxID=1723736 RepID=A0ABW1KKG1_9ACTN
MTGPAEPKAGQGGGPVALVVDDEPQMTIIIEFALQTQGFTVLTAHDGATALHLLRTHPVDLVVLDVLMPAMDGLALCERIRARSEVPIMLLTALAQHNDVIAGLEHGADDYVTKPFHPREVALRSRLAAVPDGAGYLRTLRGVGYLMPDVAAEVPDVAAEVPDDRSR